MRDKNQTEKAIMAGIEPVIEDVIALEKRVEQQQLALVALEKRVEELQAALEALRTSGRAALVNPVRGERSAA